MVHFLQIFVNNLKTLNHSLYVILQRDTNN